MTRTQVGPQLVPLPVYSKTTSMKGERNMGELNLDTTEFELILASLRELTRGELTELLAHYAVRTCRGGLPIPSTDLSDEAFRLLAARAIFQRRRLFLLAGRQRTRETAPKCGAPLA